MYLVEDGAWAANEGDRGSGRAFDLARFDALVRLIADRRGISWDQDRRLIVTFAWLCDFEAYLRLGQSISGASYIADWTGVSLPLEQSTPALDDQLRAEKRGPITLHENEACLVDEVLAEYGDGDGVDCITKIHPGLLVSPTAGTVPYDSVFLDLPGFSPSTSSGCVQTDDVKRHKSCAGPASLSG
jgi:hypothetical protein